MFFWVVCFFTRKWKKRKKFSNFLFLRFSCEETGFCVFFTRELRCLIFLHTRIALPVFSSHENSVACFFFTREFRCLFFLHTGIPLPVFSSHENPCLFFLHTRIPLSVFSSHGNPAAHFFTVSRLKVLADFGRLAAERPLSLPPLSRRASICSTVRSFLSRGSAALRPRIIATVAFGMLKSRLADDHFAMCSRAVRD